MRRITGILAISAALAASLPGGAQAAPTAEVTASFITTFYYKVGAGWVAAVACRAVAVQADPQVTALATTVRCSVNDTVSTEALPGAAAATDVLTAAVAPFTFCVSGAASFLDTVTNDIFSVTAVPKCITFEA